MKTRIGPFSLRLPVKIKTWLECAAQENNRSVTSETIFRLSSSLDKDFTEDYVTRFKQESPTSLNTDGVGIRLPPDVKELLKTKARKHRNSLNQEMVMRLTTSFEEELGRYEPPVKSRHSDYVSDTGYTLNTVEMDLIDTFRNLDEHSKSVVIKLVKSL